MKRYLFSALTVLFILGVAQAADAPAPIYTKTAQVTAHIHAEDPPAPDGTPGSGIVKVRVSFDNGVTWGAWTEFHPVASWDGDFAGVITGGKSTIKAELVDNVGNVGTIQQEVVLDNLPPDGVVSLPGS